MEQYVDPRDAFDLAPGTVHLNHGSFGAVPRVVTAAQAAVIERLLRALECPWVDILAHPTGRRILPGTPHGIRCAEALLTRGIDADGYKQFMPAAHRNDDVIHHNEIRGEFGGREGFDSLLHTAQEAGLPELSNVIEWYGIVVPAATPGAIVQRLSVSVLSAMAAPEVSERIKGIGQTPSPAGPEQFARLIREDYARWQREQWPVLTLNALRMYSASSPSWSGTVQRSVAPARRPTG